MPHPSSYAADEPRLLDGEGVGQSGTRRAAEETAEPRRLECRQDLGACGVETGAVGCDQEDIARDGPQIAYMAMASCMGGCGRYLSGQTWRQTSDATRCIMRGGTLMPQTYQAFSPVKS